MKPSVVKRVQTVSDRDKDRGCNLTQVSKTAIILSLSLNLIVENVCYQIDHNFIWLGVYFIWHGGSSGVVLTGQQKVRCWEKRHRSLNFLFKIDVNKYLTALLQFSFLILRSSWSQNPGWTVQYLNIWSWTHFIARWLWTLFQLQDHCPGSSTE